MPLGAANALGLFPERRVGNPEQYLSVWDTQVYGPIQCASSPEIPRPAFTAAPFLR